MTWAVEFELPVHQKMVLMMLANRTNSDTGRCDPSHERLAKDCGMSKESVKRAISQLAVDGIVSIVHRTESGVCLPNQYVLNIRGVGSDRPDGGVTQTLGVGSDRPTNQEDKPLKETKEVARGTRLPSDWIPGIGEVSFCRSRRPDLKVEEVAESFRDYWIAQPGQKGVKKDWAATWRTWVRNQRITGGSQSMNWRERDEAFIAQITGRDQSGQRDDGLFIDV
jgi:hypothetical protein